MPDRLVTVAAWPRTEDKLLNRADRKAVPARVVVLRTHVRGIEAQAVGDRGRAERRGPVAPERASVAERRTVFILIEPGISGCWQEDAVTIVDAGKEHARCAIDDGPLVCAVVIQLNEIFLGGEVPAVLKLDGVGCIKVHQQTTVFLAFGTDVAECPFTS